jgi:hypothetical protein
MKRKHARFSAPKNFGGLDKPPEAMAEQLAGIPGSFNAGSGRSTPIDPDSKSGEGNITGMFSKPISFGRSLKK